jgi:hypothetical protein
MSKRNAVVTRAGIQQLRCHAHADRDRAEARNRASGAETGGGHMTAELLDAGIRLVDEAHASWSMAALQCAEALRSWRDAGPSDRGAANVAYRAALDREEAAARDLERLAALVS